jgi:hypothetical protein
MHSAVNIDSSLHDWFYYGREHFEKRRSQLLRVAENSGLLPYCRGFDKSFDQRVAIWRHKYLDEPLDEEIIPLLE